MSDVAYEAAADLVTDEAAEAPVEGEQTSTEETQESQYEFPSFTADTTGIEELLEPEPESDPEYVAEPEAEEEEPAWDDDETAKLRRELAKLKKQNEWERTQRITASRKQWKEEAARRFPLADVDDINADSRRSFIKKASEQHARYERKVKPILDALEGLKAAAVTEVKAEARAEAEQAWGKPTAGPSAPVVQQSADEAKTDRGQHRTLHELTLARIKAGFQI